MCIHQRKFFSNYMCILNYDESLRFTKKYVTWTPNPQTTTDYIEPFADNSIRDTYALIRYIRGLDHYCNGHEPLLQPVITTCFALSCSWDLLTRLAFRFWLLCFDSSLP